jgi:site-specific DNA recombinase
VSRATWEAARAVLTEPGRQAAKPGAVASLLTCLMVAPCGRQVSVRRASAEGAAKVRTQDRYRCRCGCASIDTASADEIVTRLVLARLARADARNLFAADDEELAAARGELAAVEADDREFQDLIKAGKLRPATIAAMEDDIAARLAAAQARVRAFSTNTALAELLGADEFTAKTARPRWNSLSVAGQRSVLKAVAERVELGRPSVHIGRYSTELDRLESAQERITVVPRTHH